MTTVNVGFLAHVDAGKTSLTERLLHTAGVIDELGSVDDGNTQTDSLALERQRGITIKSAVVSFVVDGVTINLIDTPGHPDFVAEVERVLGVLDGAVLLVSAVEGVQAQTRVLMRTLRRLRIPTLIFVNKIDRSGASDAGVLHAISERLTPAVVPMVSTSELGSRRADVAPREHGDPAFESALLDLLSQHDDALLADYVDDEAAVSSRRLHASLGSLTRQARVHPVYVGSAITGAGIRPLINGMTTLLAPPEADPSGPASGTVFAIRRGPAAEKVAYVRMFSGTLRTRDRPPIGTRGTGKVTAIRVFERGRAVARDHVAAGQIAMLWGLDDVRIGDTVGESSSPRAGRGGGFFAPPTLETVVVPRRPSDRGRLHVALTQLAEQDPLINLRQDDIRGEVYVSLFGEVHKEVIQATLADDFGVEVTFQETTTICIERPIGTGSAVEVIGQEPNPFLATVGLRVEPAPIGSGVRFRLGVELGSMPFAFMKAVEETVHESLRQGLHGWEVTDCTVTLTHSGYWARQSHAHGTFDKSMSSTAGDFRNLTPLVLSDALKRAGTHVCEPMHRFHLEIPADTFGAVTPVLGRRRAVPQPPVARSSTYVIEGAIPAAEIHELQRALPALTRGEGIVETTFDHYAPVSGRAPSRPRTDNNPLDRKEYLLRVVRRVAGARS